MIDSSTYTHQSMKPITFWGFDRSLRAHHSSPNHTLNGFFLKPHSLLSNQSEHLYLLPFTSITIIKLSSLSINSWCLISNSTLWLVKWYLNLPTGLETDLIFTKGNTFWPFKQSLALKYGLTNNQQKRKAVSSFYFWQKYVQIMV